LALSVGVIVCQLMTFAVRHKCFITVLLSNALTVLVTPLAIYTNESIEWDR